MNALQPWHIILVAAVFLVLFGSKKLPDAARGLGRSMRIFKSEVNEMHNDTRAEPPAATGTRELSPSQTTTDRADENVETARGDHTNPSGHQRD
ncbi:Sec-independent protein translocase subunit TatA [Nocardia sp. 348MFTsu5.1]|uniref:Sec-independent protein translocase subunit TatA n=1 Tax=Nocardia sp. 348MFTsu5.1 TaxID=1172185 RepID=UPI00037C4001|nr:Sec-independent protein translocase subunit TatA [Nocardia sp. 348MFTsu5.1]